MKKILGCLRRADNDFSMILPGDRVLAAVSGGKDSLVMLKALSLYRRFSAKRFELAAININMGYETEEDSGIRDVCSSEGIRLITEKTDIAKIVFEVRSESHPCSLCSRMRRGALLSAAKQEGCNRIALGHHREDAIETLIMSMIYEGRIATFSPVTFYDDRSISLIRPMIYASEKHIAHVAKIESLPVKKSSCPMDKATKRQEIKDLTDEMARRYPKFRENMLTALRKTENYSLWDRI